MVNYENGKIYRIVCNKSGKQYIGATTISLSARLSQHKKVFRSTKSCLSRDVIEGGDYEIFLIEDFPCERKEQLLARERFHIETNDCVNKKIPLRTKHEWYMDNREDIIKRQLIWNRDNAEKTKIYKKRYADRRIQILEPLEQLTDELTDQDIENALNEDYERFAIDYMENAALRDVNVYRFDDDLET